MEISFHSGRRRVYTPWPPGVLGRGTRNSSRTETWTRSGETRPWGSRTTGTLSGPPVLTDAFTPQTTVFSEKEGLLPF